jgi:hypothetical protein
MKGLLFAAVLAVSCALAAVSRADMDCRVFSGPKLPSGQQIRCDFELNQWLRSAKASCDPSVVSAK